VDTKHSRDGDRVYLQTALSGGDRRAHRDSARGNVTGTVSKSKQPGRVAKRALIASTLTLPSV
jgi:hypothetical protein